MNSVITREREKKNKTSINMLVAPIGSPEGPCVDAARDSLYCPQDNTTIITTTSSSSSSLVSQSMPRAAPRGNPPTPKPRSGILHC